MSSEYGTPKAPQAELVKVSTTNNTARIGAYTDTSLTLRNSVPVDVPDPVPASSGATTLGGVRPFYAEDTATELDNDGPFPSEDPLPHAPNSWAIETDDNDIPRSRDPYRNQGMIGQSFFG